MEEKIISILESVGLNKNEIKVYLDLMKHKSSSALEISKRTGIHRPNTYDALRKLIDKGFISEIIEEKKRMFRAMEPEKIKDYVSHQQLEIESILPFLKNYSFDKESEEEVSVAKGVFAVREALMRLLNQKQPIYVFGASKGALDTLGLGFMQDFHKERIRKGIDMKHIYSIDSIDRIRQLKKMKLLDVRCFPGKHCSVVSTNISGDTVLLLIFSNPPTSIMIKNKEIAESYKEYFNVLWSRARVVD